MNTDLKILRNRIEVLDDQIVARLTATGDDGVDDLMLSVQYMIDHFEDEDQTIMKFHIAFSEVGDDMDTKQMNTLVNVATGDFGSVSKTFEGFVVQVPIGKAEKLSEYLNSIDVKHFAIPDRLYD